MTIIDRYFPNLTDEQQDRYARLDELYRHWNAQINVISRKDIDQLYPHHVLHSLGIVQMIRFKPGTRVLDFGCGGGFPGIPLAIMFPEVEFLLVDSIGKKIKVATAVAEALGLENVRTLHGRGEQIKEQFDFVVSRAVMRLDELEPMVRRLVHHEQRNGMPNGLICLKGGELQSEIRKYKNIVEVHDLYPTFDEEYFKTKKVVYLPL
ncbi:MULTISPECIES: 16S rRNA (guanine(527)-N(7))-methyltransferase RsmG [unclassified Porphyromonas]|uniref:16S rRNA (guanine(527)-N(7))-methyltransferase RsmG n=1 Tax=unclassified Porphyromonas TaxID=2645799 RepID=UPI00052DF730|nr:MULTISPECIES: 16S rRNA (guanine(527)-N(7))-methyltransferase RsmG [unclassified Porphyromonas]KGN83904.1 16S rRNA methyltransferase [Porphyromonas sp. COT-290 OH860]KGO01533.1 16S rRNA methyltransferase [Porphyromonas sp. COT-290 OH3588]